VKLLKEINHLMLYVHDEFCQQVLTIYTWIMDQEDPSMRSGTGSIMSLNTHIYQISFRPTILWFASNIRLVHAVMTLTLCCIGR